MAVFNTSADIKKSGTILTPHLEILGNGGMAIEFNNMVSPHNLMEPLTGRILIYLQEEFEA